MFLVSLFVSSSLVVHYIAVHCIVFGTFRLNDEVVMFSGQRRILTIRHINPGQHSRPTKLISIDYWAHYSCSTLYDVLMLDELTICRNVVARRSNRNGFTIHSVVVDFIGS